MIEVLAEIRPKPIRSSCIIGSSEDSVWDGPTRSYQLLLNPPGQFHDTTGFLKHDHPHFVSTCLGTTGKWGWVKTLTLSPFQRKQTLRMSESLARHKVKLLNSSQSPVASPPCREQPVWWASASPAACRNRPLQLGVELEEQSGCSRTRTSRSY